MKTDGNESVVTRASEARILDVLGVGVTILAGAEATSGECSVAKIVCPPGVGAPPHRHVETERFHVIRGTLTVGTEGGEITLGPGDMAIISPWALHSFSNRTDSPAEFIGIGTPGGHEAFFLAMDELSRSGRFSPEAAAEVCRGHGIELVV